MPRKLSEKVAMAPTATSADAASSALLLDMKVFAIWVMVFVLRQLQWILGPLRYRSGHWFVQYGAMAAYYLPTPLAFYAASAVYSSPNADALAIFMCFALLVTCATGGLVMTAYAISDSPLQRWRLLPWLLYFAWQQWGIIWGIREPNLRDLICVIFLNVVPILLVLLVKPPIAMLDCHTKEIADYMMRESRSSSPFFDHDSDTTTNSLLNGCKYPFLQKDGQWVNVNDVMQKCEGMESHYTVDQDVCLSYCFFWLLARRYFGFHCPEEGNTDVRDFTLAQLRRDYKRVFTIVEVQLAFVHDYFFTIYQTKITSGLLSIEEGILLGGTMSLLCILSYLFGYCVIAQYSDLVAALWGLVGALPSYLLIGLPQRSPILPVRWHPIKTVFKYYLAATRSSRRSPSSTRLPKYYYWRIKFWQYSLSSILSRQTRNWRNKIGQYSLVEDYDRRSSKAALVGWIKEHILSHASHNFVKHHTVEEQEVSVPDSVRRFVALILLDLNGPPTNGTRSLWRNRNLVPGDLSWTCRQETHTHTIMIWHIATCYVDMFPLMDASSILDYQQVATTLSKYCAYLVAFLPELLPEHSLITKIMLQHVLKEAKGLLGSTRKSMGKKLIRIQGLELPLDDASLTTFQKGVRLGRQLQELDTLVRWKVMAEFWAETILYVAPSDNAANHVERLAKGGEFVTHLWALLSNAGIMKQAAREWSPPSPTPVVSNNDLQRDEEARLRHCRSLKMF